MVTKKINSLRTSYRKERNKVLESIKCGVEPVYVPTLWYFSQLNFLENEDSPLLAVTNLDETSNEVRTSFDNKQHLDNQRSMNDFSLKSLRIFSKRSVGLAEYYKTSRK